MLNQVPKVHDNMDQDRFEAVYGVKVIPPPNCFNYLCPRIIMVTLPCGHYLQCSIAKIRQGKARCFECHPRVRKTPEEKEALLREKEQRRVEREEAKRIREADKKAKEEKKALKKEEAEKRKQNKIVQK